MELKDFWQVFLKFTSLSSLHVLISSRRFGLRLGYSSPLF